MPRQNKLECLAPAIFYEQGGRLDKYNNLWCLTIWVVIDKKLVFSIKFLAKCLLMLQCPYLSSVLPEVCSTVLPAKIG